MRRFNHIDLRVASLETARRFYAAVLPALGFTRNDSSERWREYEADGEGVAEYFAG